MSLWFDLSLHAHLLEAISLSQVLRVEGISCAYAAGGALFVQDALLVWNAGSLSIVVNGIVERLCRVRFVLCSFRVS